MDLDNLPHPTRVVRANVNTVVGRTTLVLCEGDEIMQPSVARSRQLRLRWSFLRSEAESVERPVLFGMYCRSSPFVFSLDPRCQGELPRRV